MKSNFKVRFWKTETYQGKKGTTYYVRWVVGHGSFREPFNNAALADSYRSRLRTAANDGEPFSPVTGEPVSWAKQEERTWFDFATDYIAGRWPEWSGKQRCNAAEAMMWATIAMTDHARTAPDDYAIRKALRRFAFNLNAPTPPPDIQTALEWLARHSRQVADLAQPDVARGLLHRLTTRIDGTPRSSWSQTRNRNVVKTALDRAIETGHLETNPLKGIKTKRIKANVSIDKRRCLNHRQAKQLLTATESILHSGPRLVAFFATMYYSGLRPEEAVDLKRTDITLPATNDQWGELHLTSAAPHVGAEWTDNGQQREHRGLKQRNPGDTRTVPCPPNLVAILRHHMNTYDPGPDNRVFPSITGGILPAVTCRRIYAKARHLTLTKQEAQSPLAARIYDLRHACLSHWLNAGVPPTQVAEWAGNSTDILLRVYATCITGQQDIYKQRIQNADNHDT